MSKMIFNGLEFVAGQEINNNGMFVDTDNLIDSGTYTSEFTYTAIQDCCLLFHVAGTTSTSGKLYIDGIVFQSIYTNSSDNDFKDYTFLKKGQVAKITSSQNATLEYAVYGLQSGTISNVQHNYSTSEQLIGTWIDGKPLYEKTIVANSTDISGTIQHIDVSALNIDTFVKIDGTFNRITAGSAHRIYPFNAYESSSYYSFVRYLVEEKEIGFNITMASGQSTTQQVFTLQYTKTTD